MHPRAVSIVYSGGEAETISRATHFERNGAQGLWETVHYSDPEISPRQRIRQEMCRLQGRNSR
jgi:hypothetical protein